AKMSPMKRGAFHLSAARAVGRKVFAAAVATALLLAPALPALPAAAAETGGQKTVARIWSPEILDGVDRETYRKIFTATERGRFKEADGLAAQLRDNRLMGHMLHVKYMGPHYRTSYAELRY